MGFLFIFYFFNFFTLYSNFTVDGNPMDDCSCARRELGFLQQLVQTPTGQVTRNEEVVNNFASDAQSCVSIDCCKLDLWELGF